MKAKDFLNEFYPVTVQVYSDKINDIAFLMEKYAQNGQMSSFGNLFQSVGNWSSKTFPKAQPIHHLRKLKQEADEAIADPTDIYEQIDCLIALLATMSKSGFTPEMIINAGFKKLSILKGRTWEEKADGTHQHVEK